MDVMVCTGLTVTRGTHRVCSGSVAGASAGALAWLSATVKGLRFGLTLILAEDYMVRVEWKGAFIAPVIWVAAIEAKPFFQVILLFLCG